MDPEFAEAFAQSQGFVDVSAAVGASSPGTSLVEIAREKARDAVQASVQYFTERLPPESTYTVQDTNVRVENGEIRFRCIIPTSDDQSATFPVMVWFHGGGWIVGDLDQDDAFLRGLSVEFQIVVVNVEYRLAPEHPFPTGLNDSYAALKWTAGMASSLRISLQKGFVVGGDSAGANLATVCAMLARDDPFFAGHPITGQLIRQPSVIHPDACPEKYKSELRSMQEFKDGPLLTRDILMQCRALLNPPPDDPRISPLLFRSHAGAAPAFITYNGRDPLRDDARLWAKVLREAGVNVKTECYPGVPHGFYYSFPTLSLARRVDQDTREGLRWLLAGTH